MSANQNLRDQISGRVPSWLSDAAEAAGSFGFRVLWTLTLIADAAIEAVAGASLGAVGRGGSLEADTVGQARGLIRNQDETTDDYADRLGTWVDRAKENGSSYRLALAIHDYLRSHPKIRVFRRNGYCVTVNTDRSVVITATTAWDWDSVSHPIRNDPTAPWWSDLFLVVYTTSGLSTQWQVRPGTLADMVSGDDGFALGHLANNKERDDTQGLVQLCKAAHTCLRALIWCSDNSKFDPAVPATMPNGRWGAWGIASGTTYVPSDRDMTTCRFWEIR